MEITFLGTSTMMPTKERNNTAVYVNINGSGILIDCAEGTQRQFKFAGISVNKIDTILISHWHGDHTLGLSGLIQTLGMQNYNKTLNIFGPKGSKKYFKACLNSCIFETKIKYKIIECEKGIIFQNENIKIESKPLKHSVPCNGYSIIEKGHRKFDLKKMKDIPKGELWSKLQNGKKIKHNNKTIDYKDVTHLTKDKKLTYCLDTVPTANCNLLAKNADILICESTFDQDLDQKAKDYGHMTVIDAATIANKAGVKKLILTHFSARYKTTDTILKTAKKNFKNVECAHDFLNIKL